MTLIDGCEKLNRLMPREISGHIIAFNEELGLARAIRSLQKLCDEVIVVDSGSTDRSRAIALELGALVIEQKFLGDGLQKQVYVDRAKNDWILSLDGDEELSPALIEEVSGLDLSDLEVGYSFARKNFVGNRWIRAAGFYPDRKLRLYNRKTSKYEDTQKHARVMAPKEKKINSEILHRTYQNYSDWIRTIEKLSEMDARSLYSETNLPVSSTRPVIRSGLAFFKKLFLKGGIFQGLDGWTVAITTAFHVFMKYLKLNELREGSSQKNV